MSQVTEVRRDHQATPTRWGMTWAPRWTKSLFRIVLWLAPLIAAVFAAIALCFAELHLLEAPSQVLLLVTAVLLVVSQQIHASEHEMSQRAQAHALKLEEMKNQHIAESTRLQTRVGDLQTHFETELKAHTKALVDTSGSALLGLRDCIVDMKARLLDVRRNEEVFIQHLGLDMSQAWQYVKEMFRELPSLDTVRYHALILSGDSNALETRDPDVKGWSHTAARVLPAMEAELKSLEVQVKKERKKLVSEIRPYTAFPVVHGFRVEHCRVKVCYMAFIRWRGPEFREIDWGEPKYHRIVGEHVDAGNRDLLDVFLGHFGRLWVGQKQLQPIAGSGTNYETAEITAGAEEALPPKG
jgi:hypothetical protein